MNAKITIGEMSLELTNATTAELIQLMRESKTPVSKPKEVTSITEAVTRKAKRPVNYIAWAPEDLLFIAKMALDLGPDAKVPASAIASAMKGRPGNKRSRITLYAMAYNVARYLKDGRPGNLSKTNLEVLNDNGYTGAMMSNVIGNMLGDVRRIPVQQA